MVRYLKYKIIHDKNLKQLIKAAIMYIDVLIKYFMYIMSYTNSSTKLSLEILFSCIVNL